MEYFLPIAQVEINIAFIFILSLFVGVLSGLFGVGGGFLMTPFLIFLGIPPAYAVPNEASNILGTSVSLSGLSLLFPFEFPMFAATFAKLNALGITGLLGMDPLPTNLLPHEEMQLSQIWHSIVAFIMMAIIIAHIYIGSVGMVGAYDAMGSGQVDVNWAKQHHDIWEEEVSNQDSRVSKKTITPAE